MNISVIILSYNRCKDTLELISSLERQNYKDFEIILVDNNSTDGTIKKVRDLYPNVNCIELQNNVGVPGGRNIGIKNAHGNFLVFIDNDAEVGPGFLSYVESTFQSELKAGILAFRILNYYTKDIDISTWVWNKSLLENEEFKPVHKFVGAGFALRRELINQVGLFWDDLFFMHEEKDYCMRLLRTNFLVYFAPNIDVFHKVSPEKRYESKERTFFYAIRNEFWIYIRNVPFGSALKHLSYLSLTAFLYSLKKKSFGFYIRGLMQGIFCSTRAWRLRKPLTYAQYKLYHKLSNKRKDSIRDRIKIFFLSNGDDALIRL